MIKLLIFDADGILWKVSEKDIERAMKIFFKKHDVDGNIINSRWNKIRYYVETGKIDYKKGFDIQFKGLKANEKIFKEWRNLHFNLLNVRIKPSPSVKPTLKKLKKYKLAILTDDVKSYKYKIKICKRFGLDGLKMFCSCDIGFKKPHKGAFLTVLNYFKVKPSETIFVGHSKDEVEGARKHRIRTIAYKWDKGTKSDFYVKRFSDIPKVLEKI